MTKAELETFVLRVALPPVRLALYVKHLKAHTGVAATAAVRSELHRAERIRARLARLGWWN
jgi:hypothetical protein